MTPHTRTLAIGGALAAGVALAALATIQRGEPASTAAPAPQPAVVQAPARKPPPAPAAVRCDDCATVVVVRSVAVEGQASGLGGVAGGLVGAAVGNQIGKGDGRKVATVVGTVGGAVAGHRIEKELRSRTEWEVVVERRDGTRQTFRYAELPGWRSGDRVRVAGGTLVAARG